MYNKKEVKQQTLDYFNGDDLATTVWMSKYAMKDNNENFLELTPNDTHQRVAREFYKKIKENNYDHFINEDGIFELLKDFKYIIPGGSILSQIGNKKAFGSLSNCTVIESPYDSYGGILQADQMLVQLMKRRCGVGMDISTLRPAGASVANTAGSSTGVSSFAERFSNTTREVAQDGRRGALMLSMLIEHIDADIFIVLKNDLTKVTGANISIQLSDEFMRAVEADSTFIQRYPVETEISNEISKELETYDLDKLLIRDGIMYKKVKAKKLWDLLVKTSHNTGEPGIMFRDAHHNYSTSSFYEQYKNITTNPCGEINLGKWDSCRLVALNMYSYVENPFTSNPTFNYKKWYNDVRIAQLLNDTVVDLELDGIQRILEKIKKDPEPDYIKKTEIDLWTNFYNTGKNGRRTGLGIMGLGDTIAAMNMTYGGEDSQKLVDQIMRVKLRGEFSMSIELSKISGPFDGWDVDTEQKSDFVKMMKVEFNDLYEDMMKYGRRNVSISTIAPTGSLGLVAKTTAGIEPLFATSHFRSKKVNKLVDGERFDYVDKMGDKWIEYPIFHDKVKVWSDTTRVSLDNIDQSPYHNSTAPEINWEERIKIQAICQKYITHSISITINVEKDTTVQTVNDIYMKSWKSGNKGLTVYRDGSRDGVLTTQKKINIQDHQNLHKTRHALRRPKFLDAQVFRFSNIGVQWIGMVGMMEGIPYELFTGSADKIDIPASITEGTIQKYYVTDETGKHSKYDFIYYDAKGVKKTVEYLNRSFKKEYDDFAKLVSGFLRHGMPMHSLDILLDKIHFDGEYIGTWKSGVRRIIRKYIKNEELNRGEVGTKTCPKCGQPNGIIFENGCEHCVNCDYSKC